MSDTPRTDDAEINYRDIIDGSSRMPSYYVDADYARQLERELASVLETCAQMVDDYLPKDEQRGLAMAIRGLKNAAPQAPISVGEKDTLAAHPGASSPVVAARRIWFAGVPPQGEPAPWDWIPHVEGADRQKEINEHLRKLVDDIPMAKKP